MFYFFSTRLGLLISTESAQKRLRIYPIDTRWNDFGKIVFFCLAVGLLTARKKWSVIFASVAFGRAL